jgi:drug/metabolite transporter (DMT)-like permease
MKLLLPVLFASIAAIGNAMFALGQRQSGSANGLLFVSASAAVACVLGLLCAPLFGPMDAAAMLRGNSRAVLLSGVGLFLTYFGFNLLYLRFGTSSYVLYASISIVTTSVIVGMMWLNEPVNSLRMAAIAMAVGAVILFSLGSTEP